MANYVNDGKSIWTMYNTVIASLATLILFLVGVGIQSIQAQIKEGDAVILQQLHRVEICNDRLIAQLSEITKIVIVLDSNQKERLERERLGRVKNGKY